MNHIINYIKILFSLLSTFIIFYYTNLASPTCSTINDGLYFNNNSFIGYLVNHKPGYVCPLGIILGKFMLFICIIQIYYLYNNKYSTTIKIIHFILLFIAFLLSFMNTILQQNIIWAFILQLLIIILS